MADLSQFDARYNALASQLANVGNVGGMGINFSAAAAAQIQQQMQQVVAERDAAARSVAQTNEQWHKNYQASLPQGGSASTAADAAARSQREAASAWLKNLLSMYGMGELTGSVDSLVQQWGPNTDVIAMKLKDTQQYKDRFKGLIALQQRGVNDVRNEAQYIELESNYRQVFRDANIQSYIGDAGSTAERDAIARLVGDYSVSVDEVRTRVSDAQRVVADTAPEVRDALQRYYNVAASDLVAFTLDPTRAKNRINEIANAAMIGGYAARSGLQADMGTAEQIAGLSGANDVQLQALMPQLGVARQVADATKRLANLESTDLTDSEILRSEFDLDQGAERKIKGLQSRERARFSGRSAVTAGTLSRSTGV